MDRGGWQATVHGGHKVSDATEQLTHNLSKEVLGKGIIHSFMCSSIGLLMNSFKELSVYAFLPVS